MFTFVELRPFEEVRDALFSDAELLEFQAFLCARPEAGDVIPGTGGRRKIRWVARGKGKRGGARVVYFLRLRRGEIVLVAAYGKSEREDVPRTWLRRIKEAFDHE